MGDLVPYKAFLNKRKAKREERIEKRREELRVIASQGVILSVVEIVVDNKDQTLTTYGGIVAAGSKGYGTQYYINLESIANFMKNDRVFFKVKEDGHRRIAVDLTLIKR